MLVQNLAFHYEPADKHSHGTVVVILSKVAMRLVRYLAIRHDKRGFVIARTAHHDLQLLREGRILQCARVAHAFHLLDRAPIGHMDSTVRLGARCHVLAGDEIHAAAATTKPRTLR